MNSKNILWPLFIIVVIAVIAWLLNCPTCWLLPLLFCLGAAFLGWLLGLSLGGSSKEIEEELEGMKLQHAKLNQDFDNHKRQYKDLQSEYKTFKDDYVTKFENLNRNYRDERSDWKTKSSEWENLHTKLQTDLKDYTSKYNVLKSDYDGLKMGWQTKYIQAENEIEELKAKLEEKPKEVIRKVEVEKPVEVIKEVEVIREIEVEKPIEIIKEIEVIKEVEVIKEIEVIKEVPVEVIKEVEVVKEVSADNIVEETPQEAPPASIVRDDLKRIEGIGPKIEGLLNEKGIHTWAQLADSNPENLKRILEEAGPRYQMHNPSTWPHQAMMAHEGRWDELQKLQDELDGGVHVPHTPAPDIPTLFDHSIDSPDDLKKIEGIGPHIEEVLNEKDIWTWEKLADSDPENLKVILSEAGPRFQIHDPTTWPQQARLAADGKWDELEILQDELQGGVPASREETMETASITPDDLKKIEGIGPKIEGLLNDKGIHTFDQLAETDPGDIKSILEEAGSRYQMHNPGTWPQQARLAADGKWDDLEKLQDELDGGR